MTTGARASFGIGALGLACACSAGRPAQRGPGPLLDGVPHAEETGRDPLRSRAVSDAGDASASAAYDPCPAAFRAEGIDTAATNEIGAPVMRCASSALGGWGMRVEGGATPDGLRVQVTLLSMGPRRPTARRPVLLDQHGYPPSLSELQLFDYDGDGQPEMFATVTTAGLYPFVTGRFFMTQSGGVITAYGPAQGLRVGALDDVDADGRPDAIVEFPVFPIARAAKCSCPDGHECLDNDEPETITLVAHSRMDGTFALDDDVAISEARKACPAPPPTPYARPNGVISKEMIACARLWGITTEQILARLDRECRPFRRDTASCKGPCRGLDIAQSTARFVPPLRLKAVP